MLSLKIRHGQISIQLGIDAGNGKPNPRQHVIRRHPIDMILVHLGAHNDAIIILVRIAIPSPFRRPPLLDRLGPTGGILVSSCPDVVAAAGSIVQLIIARIVGPGGSSHETVRGPTIVAPSSFLMIATVSMERTSQRLSTAATSNDGNCIVVVVVGGRVEGGRGGRGR